MIKINLVGEGKKVTAAKPKKGPSLPSIGAAGGENTALVVLTTVALVGALVVGGWWFILNRTIKTNDVRIGEAQRRVDELQEILDQVEDFKRKVDELELKIAVITDLKNNQKGPVRIMEEISKGLPELLWIDRLSMQGTRVTIAGRAFSMNAVASLTENLDKVPEFFEPALLDTTKQGEVYTFSLEFDFRPAAGNANQQPVIPEPDSDEEVQFESGS